MVLSDRFTGARAVALSTSKRVKYCSKRPSLLPFPPVFSHQSCEIAALPLHDSIAVLIIVHHSHIHIFAQQWQFIQIGHLQYAVLQTIAHKAPPITSHTSYLVHPEIYS